MAFTIDVDAPAGRRISSMTLMKTGAPIEPSREYVVAGWASVNQATEGPPIWDVVANHLRKRQTIASVPSAPVKIVRSGM